VPAFSCHVCNITLTPWMYFEAVGLPLLPKEKGQARICTFAQRVAAKGGAVCHLASDSSADTSCLQNGRLFQAYGWVKIRK
jgi:hypothetical protein